MPTSTIATTVRFDKGVKKDATKILDSLGLSFNSYLNLAVKQLVNQKQVPFEIKMEQEIPNETTKTAMLEAQAKEAGIISDTSPRFTNADDLLEYLEQD